MKNKETSNNVYIQLELNFNPNPVENTIKKTQNVRGDFSIKYCSSLAKVVNLSEKIKEIERLKEREITNYILAHSKRF